MDASKYFNDTVKGEYRLDRRQQVLASSNLNLARKIAWAYQKTTMIEYSILESAAFEGLCKAAAKYDPTMLNQETGEPLKFSSIAVPHIRGSILHYIRDRTYPMKLTHKMRENWVRGRRLLNKGFCDIQVAESLEITLPEWQDTKSACSGPPLLLKDQATPTDALEAEEVDMASGFIEEAEEIINRLLPETIIRLESYYNGSNPAIPKRQVKKLFLAAGLL